jgi:hypothetical protein
MMRRGIPRSDQGLTVVCEKCAETIVAGFDIAECAAAERDSALVRDDDEREPETTQSQASIEHAGEEVNVRGVEQVAGPATAPCGGRKIGVAAEGVIAIEKDSGEHGEGYGLTRRKESDRVGESG